MGNKSLEYSPIKRESGAFVDGKQNVSQQFALMAKMANCIMGRIKHNIANLLKEMIVLLSSALSWPHLECCVDIKINVSKLNYY